jgi:SAM-dependent methyltransferase
MPTSAQRRDLVRRGYDAISTAYRSDDGESSSESDETTALYAGWIEELSAVLPSQATVVDLGCGAGVPGSRLLRERDYHVVGVDISAVQVQRAKRLVLGVQFLQADLAGLHLIEGSVDAVVCLYALIHLPLDDQRNLFPRIRTWLRPGGYLLAIVGATRWTGVAEYFGAPMFWDHADEATYLDWLAAARLKPLWSRFIPEGAAGHALVLARAVD